MHVAMVHRDLHHRTRGGICTLYRALADQLISRGLRVTLVTQHTPHPLRAEDIGLATLPRTNDLGTHRRRVAALLQRLSPDVVECSTWEAEALDYLREDPEARAPVLVRGEFSAATLAALGLARHEEELVHRADRVIAVSAFAARDLAAAYGIPVPAVVPNGVDQARFQAGTARPPCSGYRVTLDPAGRPIHAQRLVDLFDAGTPVPPWTLDPHGRVRVLWIGKITAMKGWDVLEAVVRKLRGTATVTVLLGHSGAWLPVTIDSRRDLTILHDLDDADMPHLYRAADWLLSTSRWEGFGLAIAEALACGTPVLLPERLGTAPELLAAGGGFTYRDPDHLATLLAGMRPAGRLPQRFDWATNAEATIGIYHDLLRR